MGLQIAYIASRLIAGLAGCFLIYLALFTFEREDGLFVSRIENIWIAVDDRERITRNWPTALFNTLAQRAELILTGLFGRDLFTTRALATSVNISIAYTFLNNGYHDLILGKLLSRLSSEMSIFLAGSTGGQHIESAVNEIGLLCAIGIIVCLRYKYKNKAVRALNYFPSLVILWISATEWWGDNPVGDVAYFRILPFLFWVSAISDIAAVRSIKISFVRIATEKSLTQIGVAVSLLAILATSVVFVPIVFGRVLVRLLAQNEHTFYPQSGRPVYKLIWLILECSEEISELNVTTALIAGLPLFILVIAFIERLSWPLFSRAIYPFIKFEVIRRTKLILTVGAVCLAYSTGIWKLAKDYISLIIR